MNLEGKKYSLVENLTDINNRISDFERRIRDNNIKIQNMVVSVTIDIILILVNSFE